MLAMLLVACLIPVAYLVGTFPSAGLVARTRGRDILQEGSGNPGASNTFRLLGWKAGLRRPAPRHRQGRRRGRRRRSPSTVTRGAFILGRGRRRRPRVPDARASFKGGRGVATAAGVLVVVFPLETAVLGVVWFGIARGLRKASVASIVCAIAFPVIVALRGGSALDLAVTGGLAALVVARHLANLRRLVRGEEHGLGEEDDGGSVAA